LDFHNNTFFQMKKITDRLLPTRYFNFLSRIYFFAVTASVRASLRPRPTARNLPLP
jgi:hypothetical protein